MKDAFLATSESGMSRTQYRAVQRTAVCRESKKSGSTIGEGWMSLASRSNTSAFRRVCPLLLLAAFCTASVSAVDLPSQRVALSLAQAKKAKKAKTSVASAQTARLLEEQGQGVMQCAVKKALDKGSNKVDVVAKVTVNNRGQVVAVNVTAKADGKEHKDVHDCVDGLIRSIRFPASEAPLTEVQREWTIQ